MKALCREMSQFSLRAVFAGALTAIGAVALLVAVKEGSLAVGSVMFSFAMLFAFTFELKLFIGVSALLPESKLKKWWQLPLSLICNLIGVGLVALLINYSAVGHNLQPTAEALMEGRLANGLVSTFLTAVLCGICISLSVVGGRRAQERGLSPWVVVLFPIVIFVFCGFENSIADFAYFLFARTALTWDTVWFFCLVILGNLAGAPLITLTDKIIQKKKTTEGEKN